MQTLRKGFLMKTLTRFLVVLLTLALLSFPLISNAQNQDSNQTGAQQTTGALERGYRTGYSDGYQAGVQDAAQNAAKRYSSKEDYQSASRAYNKSYGSLEDYRDGYQQGFEAGYNAGYEGRGFDSTIPAGLGRRGVDDAQNDNNSAAPQSQNIPDNSTTNVPVQTGAGVLTIPSNTVMTIELLTNLSTDASQRGDRFEARVVEPREYEGSMVTGRVTRVKRAGKVKGTAELQLTFEQIRLTDNRFANFNAQVIEIVTGGDSSTGNVDPEGGVKGKDSSKDDAIKVGTGAGIGAVIGAIAGGGKGAAIGAIIGGGVSTGGVLASRGKDLRLNQGQQLRIRTNTETRF